MTGEPGHRGWRRALPSATVAAIRAGDRATIDHLAQVVLSHQNGAAALFWLAGAAAVGVSVPMVSWPRPSGIILLSIAGIAAVCYSSLSYLNTFPLDALKIDQSFVAGLPDNAGDSALISAIVAIAEALGLNVVAEGVETQAQATRLLDLGCQRAQGYLFHRPLTAEAFTAALTASMTSGSEPPSPALPQMGDAGPVR